MPFTNNRIYYLIGIAVVIAFLAVIIYGGTQASTKNNPLEFDLVTVTINKAIGIEQVTVNNLDAATGDFVKGFINLPYSFNTTYGDAIRISATPQTGYYWGGWQFSTGHFMTTNVLTFTTDDLYYMADGYVIITPKCNILPITTTPTPSPTVPPE